MTLTSRPHPYKVGMGPLAPEVYRAPFPSDYRGPDTETALAELRQMLAEKIRALDLLKTEVGELKAELVGSGG